MPIKRAINGSDKFKFILIDSANVTEELNFSFNYTALIEIDFGTATRKIYTDGSKSKILHWVNLEWIIDFSGLFELPDEKLVNKIKNAEFENKKIYLVPHMEVPDRVHQVQIIEDKRTLGQYYNTDQTGANKDYIIQFENVNPIARYDWRDPDDISIWMDETILFLPN